MSEPPAIAVPAESRKASRRRPIFAGRRQSDSTTDLHVVPMPLAPDNLAALDVGVGIRPVVGPMAARPRRRAVPTVPPPVIPATIVATPAMIAVAAVARATMTATIVVGGDHKPE